MRRASPDRSSANVVTYDQLVALAKAREGEVLKTVREKEFTVGVFRDCPFFTPVSSGPGRSDGRKAAERFLDRLDETGSIMPRDYSDVTRNASYFVALLQQPQARRT